MSTDSEIYFIPLGEFDPKRLVVGDAYRRKYKSGFSAVYSGILYKNDDGEPVPFEIALPPSSCAGVYPQFEYNKDPVAENMKNYQACYSLSGRGGKKMTAEQKNAKLFFDTLRKAAAKAALRETKNKKTELPNLVQLRIKDINERKKEIDAIKPIYDWKVVKGMPDKDEPQRTFLPLKGFGKGTKHKCSVDIRGPGDESVHPSDLKVPGTHISILGEHSITWGASEKNECAGIVHMKIVEMNFTPSRSGVRTVRRLGSNTAPADKKLSKSTRNDDSGDESDSGSDTSGDEEDFKKPTVGSDTDSGDDDESDRDSGSDSESGSSEDEKPVKKKPAKKVVKKKAAKASKKPAKATKTSNAAALRKKKLQARRRKK